MYSIIFLRLECQSENMLKWKFIWAQHKQLGKSLIGEKKIKKTITTSVVKVRVFLNQPRLRF